MRRVYREPLSEEALELLCKRTCQIANAGNLSTRNCDRCRARKKEAERLWDQEKTKAFEEIRRVLKRMAHGSERCMYCDDSAGSGIDHFWPKEKYPGRAYTWENYLWSCATCNSTFKGSQFPLDEHGKPLLIHPAEEDPRIHFTLSPKTGKLINKTPKGVQTQITLGFDRRGELDKARKDAFDAIQKFLIDYAAQCARGDTTEALVAQRLICRQPMASALLYLFQLLDSPGGASLIRSDCRAAIEAHPEIRHWP
ncbi:hypothetical protein [Polyangium aurulentum]|uniref:hypothetical protein n=1 Tax=Polyangium aurulentum TaxID=2567896 RepID=UPI0010ADC7FC|nr:hypothetical protein [Polyangium aurulentum]UQA62910.1 hypothetical protein E8A73_021620 [Polyangium aurulentum]